MTPAEQGQERKLTARRGEGLTFYISGPWIHGEMQVMPHVDYRHVCKRLEEVEAELEMCRRYFPFLQRSRADYKRRYEESQGFRDECERQLQEAVKRELVLMEMQGTAAEDLSDLSRLLPDDSQALALCERALAALDQSGGKP